MILLQVPAHFFLDSTSNTQWAGALLLGRAFLATRGWATRMFDQELFVDEGDERPLFWVALQQFSPVHPHAHEAGSGTYECLQCVGSTRLLMCWQELRPLDVEGSGELLVEACQE